jgi:hypothetical protein
MGFSQLSLLMDPILIEFTVDRPWIALFGLACCRICRFPKSTVTLQAIDYRNASIYKSKMKEFRIGL